MKRHKSLHILSSDHHHGLVQARALRRASKGAPRSADAVQAVAQAFLRFAEEELRVHLRQEEEVLLPCYARHSSPEDEMIVRTLTEHVRMRQMILDLVEQIQTGQDIPAAIGPIACLLEQHIRFEERIFFPHIESTIPEDRLQKMAILFESPERACHLRATR